MTNNENNEGAPQDPSEAPAPQCTPAGWPSPGEGSYQPGPQRSGPPGGGGGYRPGGGGVVEAIARWRRRRRFTLWRPAHGGPRTGGPGGNPASAIYLVERFAPFAWTK